MIKKIDPLEIHATEMSTTRMHHGEPHLTIWFTGPRGGGGPMVRLDSVEADRLLKQLAAACAALEEAATAAVYASNFRRRAKSNGGRKKISKIAY
jgi:hypothetical protein